MERTRRSVPAIEPGVAFRHILIPTDLTDRSDVALNMTGKLVVPRSSRVTLLHVIETIEGARASEFKAFFGRLERKARATMRAIARRNPGLPVEPAVVYGRRAEGIVSFAAAHDVDLIVLASHRVDPSMANRDWGTISYKVGILAQCPVLLVK
jgi:universal stress protein A